MSARRTMDGVAPRQRAGLARTRKNLRLELRTSTYRKLLELGKVDEDGKREAVVSIVERLVEEAFGLRDSIN